jgi:hypothetical protein
MAKTTNTIPPEAVQRFDKLVSSVSGLERKGATMPYTSMNGHMFAFLDKKGALALRLDEPERESFMKKYKASLCEAHGTVLKEYVAVPEKVFSKTAALVPWFKAAHDYVRSLKPKPVSGEKR